MSHIEKKRQEIINAIAIQEQLLYNTFFVESAENYRKNICRLQLELEKLDESRKHRKRKN